MELDALKEKWAEQDRRLDESLRLNRWLLLEVKLSRMRSPLQRFAVWVGIGAVLEFVGIVLMRQFLVAHWDQPRFLLPGLLLDVWLIAMLAAAVRQLTLVRGIDYEQPIAGMQRQLVALRVLRVRTTQWALLTGQFVWWVPVMVVTMKGVLGLDAYEVFGFRYILANLAFGLAVIPVAVWVARRYGETISGWSAMQGLLRDLAGREVVGALTLLTTLETEWKE